MLSGQFVPETPANVIIQSDQVAWKNETSLFDLAYIRFPIDTVTLDFRLKARVTIVSGSGLQLMAGVFETDAPNLEGNGYQAGENFKKAGYCIKKKGFTLIERETETPRGTVDYSFEKQGRTLFLNINDKEMVNFYDPNFMQFPNSLFCLGLRPGGEVVIHDITLETRPTIDKSEPYVDDDIIVKLKTKPPRYFSMTRFHNLSLASSFRYISAYILNDVTQFQEKVDLFKHQYKKEKERGKRLESLLEITSEPGDFFVGTGAAVKKIKERATTIAGSNISVLIQGPTGTGKEILARFIHEKSPRKGKPFIKVDCSALPGDLIESELFGHEKGAFRGAIAQKIGRFELANGGTLFLDEISNLNQGVQAKLLNVLQDLVIQRIGGEKAIKLDIRILAASNINLDTLIEGGSFREDLFYRINTIAINLPPLAARLDDIPELVSHFITLFNESNGKEIKNLTSSAYKMLFDYPWPGNIRELRNVIQRATLFCEKDFVDEELIQLPGERLTASRPAKPKRKSYLLKEMTKEKILEIIKRQKGVVSYVADELGISRKACYFNMAKHGINISDFREK